MYLTDAVKKHGKIKYVCCHHEQAVGYAAVGYAKYLNTPAVAIVTTGCGGTNIITPLLVAYQDYVPMIFIQGQVKQEHITLKDRKFGAQGTNMKSIVESLSEYHFITDKSDMVDAINNIKDKPIWLEVALDIQGNEK